MPDWRKRPCRFLENVECSGISVPKSSRVNQRLVDQQWSWRENQALARRLKAAKLRGPACVEDIDYRTARGLDKTVVRALAKDSAWIRNHENIFVLGPTGVGKSFIASALAQKACRDGYSAFYLRAAALLRELALARADGSLRHFLARLSTSVCSSEAEAMYLPFFEIRVSVRIFNEPELLCAWWITSHRKVKGRLLLRFLLLSDSE
jgi:hypothetical protein